MIAYPQWRKETYRTSMLITSIGVCNHAMEFIASTIVINIAYTAQRGTQPSSSRDSEALEYDD